MGKDRFFCGAIDKERNTVGFLLTKRRQRMHAQKFFNKTIRNNGIPRLINIHKSGSNYSVIIAVNRRSCSMKRIKIRQCRYLYNIMEQVHRSIKPRIIICAGFKEFESAQSTLSGIEVVNVIRKKQIMYPESTYFKTFKSFHA